jgi:hypothetical protein
MRRVTLGPRHYNQFRKASGLGVREQACECDAKAARDQPDSWDARGAFTFHLFFGCQDEGSGPPLPSNSDMKVKMKRFLLITLAACVAIDVVALWMLW